MRLCRHRRWRAGLRRHLRGLKSFTPTGEETCIRESPVRGINPASFPVSHMGSGPDHSAPDPVSGPGDRRRPRTGVCGGKNGEGGERMANWIDPGDQGDVLPIGEWQECDGISGFLHCWEVQAEARVYNEWAEVLGVPHGSLVKGTFWCCSDDPGVSPDEAFWEDYGFEDFEVLEISPQLVDDLAKAVSDILEEKGFKKKILANPDVASEVWGLAWQALRDGEYGLDWVGNSLDKMLLRVTPGEVEDLAYEKIRV